MILTTNPATGKILRTYRRYSETMIFSALEHAHAAHLAWRQTPLSERAGVLLKLAEVLRKKSEQYARLMSEEMGKTSHAARAEIEKCAWCCEVYAANAATWLAEEEVAADGRKHRIVIEPLGVILAVMPWNFPFWQAIRFLVPTLLTGNGALLKHAANVTGSALNIQEAVSEAGFPQGLFSTILASHEQVEQIIAHPLCQGVSLTGSAEAGKIIAATAGKYLKKIVLELGGSDPLVVLADADITAAAKAAVTGRFQNNGQSCIAAKRIIVLREVQEAFTAALLAEVEKLVVGDPLDEKTDIGPLVNEQAAEKMEQFVADALAKGAVVRTGGKRQGAYFPPTVLTNVTPDMNVLTEEVFGPVVPVIVAQSVDEAVALANSTRFGLGASVWSRDLVYGEQVARKLEAGAVFVNSITKSDPRMPFGGIKESGLGRELSRWGLREFVNIKTINVYDS
ncbi:succinate-semialdehyde dehydrogenase / glutarate-semialdehyde dehydrogenase [Nitrosomonas eutropha]|uniref:NAD-dependent succinate-semialdehyde dehydrogenase n=1 Tax=Nitrosomonas eutropha TaxID=916 RepID=UPI000880DE3B|nr:NAD-dependent succinate-semialdehyde dehydrogenase [Nitrosomonas eutropha]SCX05505.1 succinate-semialdehyde dehydrogenase / glutarate-semialdehyde dehydrogenase [Nitrosomonas eutropha]